MRTKTGLPLHGNGERQKKKMKDLLGFWRESDCRRDERIRLIFAVDLAPPTKGIAHEQDEARQQPVTAPCSRRIAPNPCQRADVGGVPETLWIRSFRTCPTGQGTRGEESI